MKPLCPCRHRTASTSLVIPGGIRARVHRSRRTIGVV